MTDESEKKPDLSRATNERAGAEMEREREEFAAVLERAAEPPPDFKLIASILERHDFASQPGPWEAAANGDIFGQKGDRLFDTFAPDRGKATADLVVSLRNFLPRILEALRR